MIQRKQTIFLLLAIVATLVCLALPIAHIEAKAMLANQEVYNLWIEHANGEKTFSVWALFGILAISCPINLFAIFDFRNRKRQARTCMLSMLLMLGWYAVYGVFYQMLASAGIFQVKLAAYLPLVVFTLLFIARKSILADEALVRAADRIR